MRFNKKSFLFEQGKMKKLTTYTEIDYKTIYENIRNYLVFRISVTNNLNERLAYLDILEYAERIRLETRKT